MFSLLVNLLCFSTRTDVRKHLRATRRVHVSTSSSVESERSLLGTWCRSDERSDIPLMRHRLNPCLVAALGIPCIDCASKSSRHGANKGSKDGCIRSALNYTSGQMSWFSSYHQRCWRYVKHAYGMSIQSRQNLNMPKTCYRSLEELSNICIICA